jgi:hypothetical protein
MLTTIKMWCTVMCIGDMYHNGKFILEKLPISQPSIVMFQRCEMFNVWQYAH